MPAMLRPKGKAILVAFKVLGMPANLRDKKSAKQKRINRRLLFEETARVR